MICLQVEGLTKQFGAQTVVDTVSFELQTNSSTALIGPNGAGKTTTLSMLTGLLTPTKGSIVMPGVKDIRSEIGFLPQYPQFFSWMTSLEFVEMSAKLSGVPAKEAKIKSQKMLEFVGLGDALNKKTGTFSGGMRQRLGIAQAIVHSPKLILLDEPVSALDPVGRRDMMNLLKQLQETTTILYSTHILNDAEQMTDQVLFLRDGKLVEKGSLTEVRTRYDEPKIQIDFATTTDATRFADSNQHVIVNGSTVLLTVADNTPTMQHVIEQLSIQKLDVLKVERVTTSLEEIFMKVAHK
jgi:ABC-2 type transport system ATP-binding protein